jgi:serine/threonine-protein kinase
MARVFDGFDERLERPVAVKILRPETEALPGMRKRFQQEARISARLVHHNIVPVLDYGEDGAASYLVMERLPGRTLRDEIARGPMPPERLTALMSDTLGALAAAHRFGVLHRDIKPSNILLDDDGHARLTDFGIAKSFDARGAEDATSDMTMTGVVLGTPGYLAPERRAGQSATVQSDLYSVGAVMVEALSGRRLMPGEEHPPDLPPHLRAVATKALTADPQQRFSSAAEMLHALQTHEKSLPFRGAHVTATEPTETAVLPAPPRTSILRSPPAPRPPAARRWRRYLLPAVAAAIVLALLLLFLLTPGRSAPSPGSASRTTALHHQAKAGRDPQATAIRQLATSIAGGGLPGDEALATSLDATAAAKAGVTRDTAAQATLTLAGVLYAGGGISGTQLQDVANALQSTGATVPTTTVPTTPAPTTPPPGPGGKGPGHGHPGDENQANTGSSGFTGNS